ncbi:MAG TPA: Ig-like domain-containing protein [Gemmatimonadaceae bacterium]|nr:Ig-like domain-containing protein [Gemmatimonadaceae bacterium]
MLVTATAAACAENATSPVQTRPPVAAVRVSPEAPTLLMQETMTLTATALDADGQPVTGYVVAWASSDERVATVAGTGVVTPVAPGVATVTAGVRGKFGRVVVTVAQRSVARVQLDVREATLTEGVTRQLAATATDAMGNVITDRFTRWTSTDPAIVSVSPLGMMTAIKPGQVEIQAQVEGQRAAATITVNASRPYVLLYDAWSGRAGEGAKFYGLDIDDEDASPVTPLDAGDWGRRPRPSPDGRQVLFSGTVGGILGLYIMNVDGGAYRRLLSGPSFGEPSWSPDGTKIVFVYRPPTGPSDIWVLDLAGATTPVNLTADLGRTNESSPAWSPSLADGSSRIAFVHSENGVQRIWTMKPDGSDKRQLTSGDDAEPAWSPDGQTIAYQKAGVATFGDIYLVPAVGGAERALIGFPLAGPQWSPSWSPDGRMVAFASMHETYGSGASTNQIYTVWTDGTRLARRTSGAMDKQHPAWIRRIQ